MKLVTLLLLIQTGYNVAKTINYQRSCDESQENDPRLKRSEEKEHSDVKDTEEQDLPTRKSFFNNYNFEETTRKDDPIDESGDLSIGRNNKSNEFISVPVQQILPIINDQKIRKNVDANGKMTDHINIFKNSPSNQPVMFHKIDPKFILISKPYNPYKTNMDIHNNNTDNNRNIYVKESEPAANYLISDNSSNTTNVTELNVNKTIDAQIVFHDTDVTNIRELREHLLDHLLGYFINIIKEEQYRHNDTRKKNGKDKMKVEEKLRNYYDPNHLDVLFDEDDDDPVYEEDELYLFNYGRKHKNENVKGNPHQDNNGLVTVTNIDPSNMTKVTLDSKTRKNVNDFNETNTLEDQKISSTIPDIETLYKDIIEPSSVTSKYINSVTNDTSSYFDSLNDTEINITTYVNNVTVAELGSTIKPELAATSSDFDLLANTNDEYYTDYLIDSDEYKQIKNLTDVQKEKNDHEKNVIIEESEKKQDVQKKESEINLNQSPNSTNVSTDLNKSVHVHIKSKLDSQKTKIDYAVPCNDQAFAENKNIPSKRNEGVIKKSKNISRSDAIVKNNIKIDDSNKTNCRKSIVLNLNINLI